MRSRCHCSSDPSLASVSLDGSASACRERTRRSHCTVSKRGGSCVYRAANTRRYTHRLMSSNDGSLSTMSLPLHCIRGQMSLGGFESGRGRERSSLAGSLRIVSFRLRLTRFGSFAVTHLLSHKRRNPLRTPGLTVLLYATTPLDVLVEQTSHSDRVLRLPCRGWSAPAV